MKCRCVLFHSFAFFIFAAIAFAQETDSTGHAVISVEARQLGLPVLIDGREVGFTPLRYFSLLPGKHEIAVKQSRPESWLDSDWVETVTLQVGDTLNLVARFLKGYSLNSTPFGAEVYSDGIFQGTTPLVLHLPEGQVAHVEIRRAGYQSAELEIGKVIEGDKEGLRLVAVILKEEKTYAAVREGEQSRWLFRVSRNRRIAWVAAGLSLASGVAAILLKQKADDLYEQYLTASVPTEMERLYDRTADYDRYSGIATAVFEASFAVSFYFFLKSTHSHY
jgi:hypothetical protein